MNSLVSLITLLFFLSSCTSSVVRSSLNHSVEDIQIENSRWSDLGLDLKGESILIEKPFTSPVKNRSFIVPYTRYQDWMNSKQPYKVKRDDFAEDLKNLEFIMQDGYGGWDLAASKGWNWKQFFENWRAFVLAQPEELELLEALSYFKQFKDFQLDNHTNFLVEKTNNTGALSAKIVGNPTEKCSALVDSNGNKFKLVESDLGQQPKRVKLFNAKTSEITNSKYVVFPWNKKNIVAIICGNQSYNLEMTWQPIDGVKERASLIKNLSQENPDWPSFRKLENDIAYLRLPTFSAQNIERLQQLAKDLPKDAGAEKLLVVDLRLNGGGDGESSFVVLKNWIDIKRFDKVQSFQRHIVHSCTARSLHWGYCQISTRELKPPISDYQKQELQKELENLFTEDESCKYSLVKTSGDWFYSKRKRENLTGKKILVLVDNFCGSDCELVTYLLGSLEETVIAGQNTFGVMQFIQPGYSLLPRTGIPFRLARGVSYLYGDNRAVDGYGFDVDILLSQKEDMDEKSVLALAKYLIVQQRFHK